MFPVIPTKKYTFLFILLQIHLYSVSILKNIFIFCLFMLYMLVYTGREGPLGHLIQCSLKFYNNVFVGLTTLGTFIIFLIKFIKLSVQKFQPLISIYRRGNFVYHHWICRSIYRPLSYPLDPYSLHRRKC